LDEGAATKRDVGQAFACIRIAQLGAVRMAASAANSLDRQARHLEVRLDGLDKGLNVAPITNIAWPAVDLSKCGDPILAILSSTEFQCATRSFADSPASQRSLVSPQAQALLYSILRNLRPDHVFEIGSYKAGTAEALCRALHANSHGVVHTVDPFRADYIAATIKHWPQELLAYVRVHSVSSMDFYMDMERQSIHPGVVFVDGNHDYEFALFDIGRAAKYMAHGVLSIFSQPTPGGASSADRPRNPSSHSRSIVQGRLSSISSCCGPRAHIQLLVACAGGRLL
jgi:hypothetical protein